jgi:hypothetical protein
MSASRRKVATEFKIEAAHRVIDSGRTISTPSRLSTDASWPSWFRSTLSLSLSVPASYLGGCANNPRAACDSQRNRPLRCLEARMRNDHPVVMSEARSAVES